MFSPFKLMAPALGSSVSDDRRYQFVLTISLNACDTDDLPTANLEADVVDDGSVIDVQNGDALDMQRHLIGHSGRTGGRSRQF